MKKLFFTFLLAAVVCSGTRVSAQVFGYPGARWVFYSPEMWSMCSELCEVWEYTGDTMILGTPAKKIEVMRKNGLIVVPDSFQISYFNRYYHVTGDSVYAFIEPDSAWQLMYDFSLQLGDTTHSPLRNIYGTLFNCEDDYDDLPALVTNVGLDTVAGQTVKFYTVHYIANINFDTTFAYQTYYERLITFDYWYAVGTYFCGAVIECGPPTLNCYKDDGMITDSSCYDLSWIDHLSVSVESSPVVVKIFPNPVSNQLFVDEPNISDGKYIIISLDGKQITDWIQSPINVATLEPGMYWLVNEARTWTKKFIKN